MWMDYGAGEAFPAAPDDALRQVGGVHEVNEVIFYSNSLTLSEFFPYLFNNIWMLSGLRVIIIG